MILASPSTWRSHPHSIKGYLYAHVPDVVFQASVNQTTFTNPVVALTYDNVTVGAYTDIVVGMKVRFEDDSGNVKGYGVIRKTPTSTQLFPIPVGYNDLQFEDNDVVVVLDEYPLVSRTPRIDAALPRNVVMYKNYDTAYVDQGAEPNPVAVVGPDYIHFVDADTSLITVDFDMTDSYAIAPSATISSYSGDIADGTVTSGSIASGIFTATFPAGKRHVLLTVTDSNDKTHTAKRLVVGCERTGANAPLRVAVGNLRGSLEGWDAEFTILEDSVPQEVIRDGAKLLYFEEEVYDGVAGSLNGYAGREHIKFIGWAQSDNVSIDPETSDIVFTATSSLGIMRTLPGFSQSVEIATSPTKWHQMKSLTLFRAIWYVLHWHTTMLDICDLEQPSWYASYPYPRFDVDQADPHTQVDTMASFVTARLTADRHSIFYLRKNPVTLTTLERDNLNTIVSLTAADWTHIGIEERHRRPNYWLRASGLLASATGSPTAYLSIAPSTLPGDGQNEDSFDRQLVESQTDLNIRAGHIYAERNSGRPRQTIKTLNAGMVVDPGWREWVKFTLDAETNKRGISYSSDRFVPLEVAVNLDVEVGAAEEDWVVQEETTGVPATAYTLPANQINDIAFTPLVPFELTIPDLIPLEQLPVPVGATLADTPAYYLMTLDRTKMFRCRNFGTGSEHWEQVLGLSDFPDAPTLIDFLTLDSWNPKNVAYVTGFRSGSPVHTYIYAISNLNALAGQQVINRIYDAPDAGSTYWRVHSSINVQGLLWHKYVKPGLPSKVYYTRRTSPTGSFEAEEFLANTDPNTFFPSAMGNHWASASSGRMYVVNGDEVYESTDGGNSFTVAHDEGTSRFFSLIVPYDNNPEDKLFFAGLEDGRIIKRDLDGSTITDVDPSGAGQAVFQIHAYTGDRNYMVCITAGRHMRISTDGGDTWDLVNSPVEGTGNEGNLNAVLLGWPFNPDTMVVDVVTGAYRGIWWTDNLFSGAPTPTWHNAIGDFEDTTTYIGILDGVPVWLT